MDETLREKLNIPVVGGEIIAYFESRASHYEKILNGCYQYIGIESWKYHLLITQILRIIADEKLKLYGDFEEYKKIIQFIEKIDNYEFSYELLKEITEIFNDFDKEYFIKSNTNFNEDLLSDFIDCKKFVKKLKIRLKGIRIVFGESEQEVVKLLDDATHFGDIIEKVFDKEPRRAFYSDWRFDISFSGPDRRFLDGSITVKSSDMPKLIEDIEIALQKMKSLRDAEFTGIFTKTIRYFNPKLEVVSNDGKIELNFWVGSKNYQYSRTINISNLEKIINELKQVEEKGKKLTSTLEVLCF